MYIITYSCPESPSDFSRPSARVSRASRASSSQAEGSKNWKSSCSSSDPSRNSIQFPRNRESALLCGFLVCGLTEACSVSDTCNRRLPKYILRRRSSQTYVVS